MLYAPIWAAWYAAVLWVYQCGSAGSCLHGLDSDSAPSVPQQADSDHCLFNPAVLHAAHSVLRIHLWNHSWYYVCHLCCFVWDSLLPEREENQVSLGSVLCYLYCACCHGQTEQLYYFNCHGDNGADQTHSAKKTVGFDLYCGSCFANLEHQFVCLQVVWSTQWYEIEWFTSDDLLCSHGAELSL